MDFKKFTASTAIVDIRDYGYNSYSSDRDYADRASAKNELWDWCRKVQSRGEFPQNSKQFVEFMEKSTFLLNHCASPMLYEVEDFTYEHYKFSQAMGRMHRNDYKEPMDGKLGIVSCYNLFNGYKFINIDIAHEPDFVYTFFANERQGVFINIRNEYTPTKLPACTDFAMMMAMFEPETDNDDDYVQDCLTEYLRQYNTPYYEREGYVDMLSKIIGKYKSTEHKHRYEYKDRLQRY